MNKLVSNYNCDVIGGKIIVNDPNELYKIPDMPFIYSVVVRGNSND